MSYISRIAFSTRGKAEKFQKKHGGKIITFEQAFKNQLSNPSSDVEKKPVEVKPRDKCPVCGMFVAKYPKWIAQIIFKDDTYAVFDGAKDMFKYYFNMNKYNPSKRGSDIFAIYVTEYYSTNLMEAERLFFVQGSNIYGPMGKELIPIATEKRAMEFLNDHHGKKILRFNEVTMEELK
ncbi:MAG: nitrous oxide reductase accessory protein NosL [Nitrospirae bacterium]|nr:nitrous oxide reductase accessory protein NosL [Nitrospirota bacterium]